MHWNFECWHNPSSNLAFNFQCPRTFITSDHLAYMYVYACIWYILYITELMSFHECFTWVSPYMHTGRLLFYKYFKSSAHWMIGISTENHIQYFATPRSFRWFLGSHLNKPEPTTKTESPHKNSTMYHSYHSENIKAPRHWPLCGEFTGDRWILRTNGQ